MIYPLAETAIVVAIALGGGWLATRLVQRFSGRPDSLLWVKLSIATIAMVLWSYWIVPAQLLLPTACLGWALIVLGAIDLAVMRLPDAITLPLIAVGLLIAIRLPQPTLVDRLVGAAAGYGVFAGLSLVHRMVRGYDGLGLGDAKLAAGAGAWLGWATLPIFVLLACLGGFALVALRRIRCSDSIHGPLPFGVPLAGALWLMWLYAPYISPLP